MELIIAIVVILAAYNLPEWLKSQKKTPPSHDEDLFI